METAVKTSEKTLLSRFVQEECERRLRAYEAQPRDAAEHFETENEVLSGGYAYRQLYEVVQNAADAVIESGEDGGRIHVKLTTDRLETANTGAALGADGIVALLNARSSSKRGDQIGRFGVGFKSLLKLGGRIDLVSRSIGLRFDPDACRQRIREHLGLPLDALAPGMRLAEVLDPDGPDSLLSTALEYGWATTVVSARIAEESAFRRVSQEMEAFPPEFLLFLPADIELDLEIEGAATRHISKRMEGDVSIVSDGTNETRWKLFETRVKIESAEARADATHIQARADIPLAWAVPLGGREQAGRFWAFFPTETHSLTSGILNAPWKLNSDRTNLIRGPWNEAIMETAAELIASALPALPASDDRGAALSAFPRQPERQDEIAVPLVRALWDQIIKSEVLQSVNSTAQRPSDVTRHFIEDAEICASWADLANANARNRYLHPDCYSLKARISRLNALDAEAKRRDAGALSKASAEEWLDCIGSADPHKARKSLLFVGALLQKRHQHGLYSVPEAHLIPTKDGGIATPSQAILVSGADAPAGFFAVEGTIASDPLCRTILVDRMNVRELAPDSWGDLLETSLEAAEASDRSTDWENFWRNLCSAPIKAKQKFVQNSDVGRVKFRAKSGEWVERHLLVVGDEASSVSAGYLMDLDFHRNVQGHVPGEWLTEFPSTVESADRDDAEIKDYLRWVSPHFDAICRERVGSIPQYLPKFSTSPLAMPAGWRLLPHLPSSSAAQLTMNLLRASTDANAGCATVAIVHPTRENVYPKVSAPHPIYYWLTERGRICVGKIVVPVKCFSRELAEALDTAQIDGFDQLARFFRARDRETDLRSRLTWTRIRLTSESSLAFWKQVFSDLEKRQDRFTKLHNIWERAYADGAVPTVVPTSDGPVSLSEIYVTSDPSVGHDLDDGHIVLLSADAISGWIAAGAQPLGSGSAITFHKRLSEPFHLLDLFPELAGAQEIVGSLNELLAVWVEGLEEKVGPFRRTGTVAMDPDGALVIDRHRFESHGWVEGIELLLRCLSRHGIIKEEKGFGAVLANILDRRADEARKAVRTESSLERRVLRAVGGESEVLLGVLPPAASQAVGEQIDSEGMARLAIAVHGPALLSRLRDVLESQGLAPPKRWGGEQTKTFVLELGFPLEFASTVGGRRDAELSVSGPVTLPPLHDYQEEILSDVGKLLSSGAGRRRAVVSLPTGGGKTRIAAEAVVRLVLRGERRRSVLWIAQTDELCEQAVQCFRQLWVNIGEPGEDLRIVRLWGGQRNPTPPEGDEATAVVASIQTLNSRSGRAEIAWIAQAGIIIIDECHHAITSSYTDLLRWLDIQVGSERARERETPVLGLSATPWRGYNEEESERLAGRFDRRWFPADQAGLYEKLSAMGVLAERSYKPLRYERPVTLTERERQHVNTFGELPDSVVDRIGEDNDRNDLIIEAVLQSKAESILLFANSVSHAQYLAARLHLAGCPAAAVSGQTDRLARQYFTRRFRSGDLRIICNHSVLTTGFDAPKADMVLISRPVFSPVLYMQMVGRGLRGPANGGTEHCEIVTVEDNFINFRDRLAFHFCRRFFDT